MIWTQKSCSGREHSPSLIVSQRFQARLGPGRLPEGTRWGCWNPTSRGTPAPFALSAAAPPVGAPAWRAGIVSLQSPVHRHIFLSCRTAATPSPGERSHTAHRVASPGPTMYWACTDHTAGPARWVCIHTVRYHCGRSQRWNHWCHNDKADSSLHQLHLRNSHPHRARSTGLLYLACISDRSQTDCYSCQGWRSQGCHCTDRADMILQVQKGVQNSLLHTCHSVVLCTRRGIRHRSAQDSGLSGRSG